MQWGKDRRKKARSWRLELLGEARLSSSSGLIRLERKEAALLAWLALEGVTSRQQLSTQLWPEAEEKARTNMRQLLRRLKLSAGEDLATGRESLALVEGVAVDAVELRQHVSAGRFAQALALEGSLLATFEYTELPAFHDWLTLEREHFAGMRRRAAAAEMERLEREGRLTQALALAEQQLSAEPHSEEMYRRLMRLHYLLGDRTAALGLYEMCRQMLRRELDTEPLPETAALAREIERGGVFPQAAPGVRTSLPASVLRPPVLAGREEAWAQLETAWAAGQLAFIAGAPGLGKSRLAPNAAWPRNG
jgi:DNA-binding SARP family transcriptional activator